MGLARELRFGAQSIMRTIRLELDKRTVDEKISQGSGIQSGVAANPAVFPDPNPGLPEFAAVVATLQEQKTARDNLIAATHVATLRLQAAEKTYDNMVTQLAAYAQCVTAGDAASLERAGFELRRAKVPTYELGAVQSLVVRVTAYPGMLHARWDRLHGAKFYEVQVSLDLSTESDWRTIKSCTASKTIIEGLTSGTRIWVRVRGLVKDIKGPYSSPAPCMVP